jgi:hypothetical protein
MLSSVPIPAKSSGIARRQLHQQAERPGRFNSRIRAHFTTTFVPCHEGGMQKDGKSAEI